MRSGQDCGWPYEFWEAVEPTFASDTVALAGVRLVPASWAIDTFGHCIPVCELAHRARLSGPMASSRSLIPRAEVPLFTHVLCCAQPSVNVHVRFIAWQHLRGRLVNVAGKALFAAISQLQVDGVVAVCHVLGGAAGSRAVDAFV